jgi:hypothetical protein
VFAGVSAVLVACGFAGCARPARTAPSRAACPAPRADTRDWRIVQDSAEVVFRLPPAFVERARSEGAREWLLTGDFQQYVLTGFIASSSPVAALGRAPAPGMLEMSQCVDSVGGREVLVQAWRTVGGTFREGRRRDRYDVFAVVAVHPELRFYLASGSYRRQTQDLALAVVRSIAIGPGPPR